MHRDISTFLSSLFPSPLPLFHLPQPPLLPLPLCFSVPTACDAGVVVLEALNRSVMKADLGEWAYELSNARVWKVPWWLVHGQGDIPSMQRNLLFYKNHADLSMHGLCS